MSGCRRRSLRAALQRGEGGAGRDADGTRDPHLQHHDRRAAPRRGGADRGAMSSADGGTDAAAFCADLVRSHDFARYASTLFVPAEERRALLALYAFNVEISRVRDHVTQPLPGEIRLQWWTRHAGGRRPWRRRGQSGRVRAAARDRQFRSAGRAAVAADRRASSSISTTIRCRPSRRWRATSTIPRRRCLRWRRGSCGAALGRDRASGTPCRSRAGLCAGDRRAAARCGAPPIVPAAAIPGKAMAAAPRRCLPAGRRRRCGRRSTS